MKLFAPKTLTAFKNYKSKDYISDIVAGVIVAIIALPLSIALAIASGATPERGLFTAIIAGFVTSLLGGSKVNITGPTAAFATIVAGIILTEGMDGLVLATIMAGLLLILMGLLRVGTLIKYIPHTITIGFTAGIAVTLVVGQLKDFLGLTYPAGTTAIETMEKLTLVVENISTFNPWAFAVGVLGLVILILWPKVSKKIPGSLIAVLVGALVCLIPVINANTIGSLYTISSALPTFHFPEITGERILALLPSAFTIALLAGIESLLSCVVSDKMVDDTHNSNTELIALGTSNILVGCFGGIPATGAIARTAANVKNGGKSPISGMVHAVVLLLILVLLMPLASYIPMPIIAAILFIVAYNMSEWREFVAVIKTKKWNDILVLVLTFALTVIFDLVKAIAVGLIVHYVIVLIYFIIAKRKAKKEKTEE
ncbi:MAG: sodium-independent anion transporter [Clostridia bacterium]|nr:sodium-independent anion transporter [Clostridia bacterium]